MSKDIEQNENIGEQDLNAVVGGSGDDPDLWCQFTPEIPIQHNGGKDGWVWVKCGSTCFGTFCKCEGSDRCKNKWHLMQWVRGFIWSPSPIFQYNHEAADKIIINSDLPIPGD